MNADGNIEAHSVVIFRYMTSSLVYSALYSVSCNLELEFFLSHLAKGVVTSTNLGNHLVLQSSP